MSYMSTSGFWRKAKATCSEPAEKRLRNSLPLDLSASKSRYKAPESSHATEASSSSSTPRAVGNFSSPCAKLTIPLVFIPDTGRQDYVLKCGLFFLPFFPPFPVSSNPRGRRAIAFAPLKPFPRFDVRILSTRARGPRIFSFF